MHNENLFKNYDIKDCLCKIGRGIKTRTHLATIPLALLGAIYFASDKHIAGLVFLSLSALAAFSYPLKDQSRIEKYRQKTLDDYYNIY